MQREWLAVADEGEGDQGAEGPEVDEGEGRREAAGDGRRGGAQLGLWE